MDIRRAFLAGASSMSILAVLLWSMTVYAHEGRNVGDFNFVVGFVHEPAYEGQLNAVSLKVSRVAGDEHQGMSVESEENDGHEVDVMTHGALFISPSIETGESFEFRITDDLYGVDVPYHVHPGDLEGVLRVANHFEPSSANLTVMIMDDAVSPDDLHVHIGDTIVWMNHLDLNAVVMSGPLSSMAADGGEETAMDDPEPTGEPVPGLASTLQVEVTHLATSTAKVMDLTEVFGSEGHYIAEFIPTAPGDYQFRFFGTIEGLEVDETFNSGPDTFDTVVAADAIQFPIVFESGREIQNAAQGAIDAARDIKFDVEDAKSDANLGLILAVGGGVAAVFALALSISAFWIARRPQ